MSHTYQDDDWHEWVVALRACFKGNLDDESAAAMRVALQRRMTLEEATNAASFLVEKQQFIPSVADLTAALGDLHRERFRIEEKERAERERNALSPDHFGSILAWAQAGAPGLPPVAHGAAPVSIIPYVTRTPGGDPVAARFEHRVAPADWPEGEFCPPEERVPLTPELAILVGERWEAFKAKTRAERHRDKVDRNLEALYEDRRTSPPLRDADGGTHAAPAEREAWRLAGDSSQPG